MGSPGIRHCGGPLALPPGPRGANGASRSVERDSGRSRRGYRGAVTTYDARAELGESYAPAEDQVTDAFATIVTEGAQRLHRSWREVLATGLAGGLEVATCVLAL